MMRKRTTVKVQPGLFLQPHILDALVGAVIGRVVEGSEVTGSEFAVTSWINSAGSATPSEVAQALGMSPTTVSAMIERLVQKGQLRRVSNPEDGRSYLLEPTEQGRATQRAIGTRFRKEMDSVRANLAGDPDAILAAMRLLEDALRKTLSEP